MEHATKCRNRSRVALSSIFHPLGSPETQSNLESVAVKCSGPGGEAKCHLLCSQSPCLVISTKGLGICLRACGYGASQHRGVLAWQRLAQGV